MKAGLRARDRKLVISAWRVRLRGDVRGASAVEFAIIAPLFFMLVFGAITGALAYQQRNELTSATREGGRYGATLPHDAVIAGCSGSQGACWAAHVRDVTISRAFGNLDDGIAGRKVCAALVEGNPPSVVGAYVSDPDGLRPAGQDECYNDVASLGSTDPGRRVQVAVEREGQLNAILFRMSLTLGSEATVQYEDSSGP